MLTCAENIRILIDPFISKNPLAHIDLSTLKADYILLTHAHGDHIGDTLSLADKQHTTIVCVSELASYFAKEGYKTHAMQIGGAFTFDFGRLKLYPATHGSMTPDGRYGGLAAGIVLEIGNICLYHAGDTGLFGDMKLIAELHKVDYFMVPIGGNFTMDIQDATIATSWIKPKYAIPMHYDTFPVIKADPQVFRTAVQDFVDDTLILQPGAEISL